MVINKNRLGTECKVATTVIETIDCGNFARAMTEKVVNYYIAILIAIYDDNTCLVRYISNKGEEVVNYSRISFPESTPLYTAILKQYEDKIDQDYNSYSITHEYELITNERKKMFTDKNLINECKKIDYIILYIKRNNNVDLTIDHIHADWKQLALYDKDGYFIDDIVLKQVGEIENFEY